MRRIKIDFRKNAGRLFNRSFFEIRRARKRFVVVFGGAGTGKSVSVHQSEIIRLLTAKHDTLVLRKHSTDIKDSCYALFESQAERFGIHSCFTWRLSPMRIVNTVTKKKILFRGIDDPEKVKSIVGIQRIIIEEASELTFEDFRELNRRVRGIKGIQIIMILNPIDENHWIKKQFIDPRDDSKGTGAYTEDTEVFKYLYTDNKFLTPEDIKELERLKLIDPVEYDIYVLAKWGVRDNKRAWLYNYSRHKHLKDTLPFLPGFPVYLSFDFNNEPFACIAAQMSEEKGSSQSFVHFIKEFSGNWKVEEMCERIMTTYPNSILYVTGDKSGNNEDLGRNETLYKMIQGFLELSDKQMILNNTNLEHKDSQILCNTMFSVYPNVYISAEGCPNLASQCEAAKVDVELDKNKKPKPPGALLKDRGDNKNDEFDGMRYFFQSFFHEYIVNTFLRMVKKKQTVKKIAA